MIAANFAVFKFDRAAKETILMSVNTEYVAGTQVDFTEVCRVLKFLYPTAAGVRITLMNL